MCQSIALAYQGGLGAPCLLGLGLGRGDAGGKGRWGHSHPTPPEEGQGGSPRGRDATSSRHSDWVIHDGIVEITLFIPGHTFRLGVPLLI